jgi:two-component system, NarL family, nitrate/nitrite response regulator NarL
MIRIMIVDDHTLIHRVIREVIWQDRDLEIVAEACNGYEAETQAAQTHPDVVLMDLDMPECDGFEATERVLACSPHSRIVIFTASHYEHDAFSAIQRGAMGYLTKDVEPDTLLKAIRCAARDELYIARPLANRVLAHIRLLQLLSPMLENARLRLSGGKWDQAATVA